MKKEHVILSVSQLGNWHWKDDIPREEQTSGVILRYYCLHQVPVCRLDWGDIRFYIGQAAALLYHGTIDSVACLVSISITYLQEDLFVETDYYRGDLLKALFYLDESVPDFWAAFPAERQRLIALVEAQQERLHDRHYLGSHIRNDLVAGFERLKALKDAQ